MKTDELDGASMVLCQCQHPRCRHAFLVFSNLGVMCCPHCSALVPTDSRVWGQVRVKIVFVPEEINTAEIIPIDPTKR